MTHDTATIRGLAGLHQHHLADLRASGLADETIIASGCYTEDRHGFISAMLNGLAYPKSRGPALVIPFREPTGELNGFRRCKPTIPAKNKAGKPIKYLSPKDTPSRCYFPLGIGDTIADRAARLLIVEGEKKTLAGMQAGFPTIGLTGAWNWKLGKGADRLIADLEAIAWDGRPVFIVFDSDAAENENVRLGESRLAAQLQARGASVKCVRLPSGPDGAKCGLDDFLLAHGKAALWPLLDSAEDPEPAEVQKTPARDLDPMPEARRFLAECATHDDGCLTLRFWRDEFHAWRDGRFSRFTETELRARLMLWLDSFACDVTRNVAANVLEGVRAQAIVGSHREQPTWLDLDSPPFPADEMLAMRSGLLHVPSMLRGEPCSLPATPHYFAAGALDFDFDPAATCPVWECFLEALWKDDRESIDTLAEVFGYLAMRRTEQHKLFMLVGPTRGGKGVVARAMKGTIGGSNVASPTLASLGGPFGLSQLLGKSVAIVADARLSGRADAVAVTEELLSISGEDDRPVNRKNLPILPSVRLPVRFVILTNELPNLRDASGALLGRVVLLRLTESWLGREDRTLDRKIQAELPGILNWSIRGWERLRRRGHFIQPASGGELLAELAAVASPVGQFVREQCIVGPHNSVTVDDLFAAWCSWCEASKRRETGTVQSFGRDLHAVVATVKAKPRKAGGEYHREYDGISLR
ncbi:MAG: phage/plasmid primase, P4 family [Planctomycetales bacterium]